MPQEIHSGREGFSVTFFSYRIKNNPRPKYRLHPVAIESVIGGNSHAEGGIRRGHGGDISIYRMVAVVG